MLAKSKPNIIETLISQALIDMEISHEEFIAIFKEKDKDENMKENLRSENKKTRNYKTEQSKIKDLSENSQKLLSILCHQKKKKNVCVCMYQIYLISTEGYKKANVHHLIVQKAGEI